MSQQQLSITNNDQIKTEYNLFPNQKIPQIKNGGFYKNKTSQKKLKKINSSLTNESKSEQIIHLQNFQGFQQQKPKNQYNFFKSNSKKIKKHKNKINSHQTDKKANIDKGNSQSKLKRIISSDAELFPRKKEITKSTKHTNNYFSKQAIVKESKFSIQDNDLLNKAKSYTKFIDFFEESSQTYDDRKTQPYKRMTSINGKNIECTSIRRIDTSLKNNDFPFFTNTKSNTHGNFIF